MAKPDRAKRTVMISVEEPRPLLDEGNYRARCTAATVAWSRRWQKWIVRLVMEPLDYTGCPYTGQLCKFLSLGTDPKKPRAGQASRFRTLWVEVNGGQPTKSEVDMQIFVGHIFRISVRTVKAKADREHTPIPAEHWYSIVGDLAFCKFGQRTLEHRQDANTGNTCNTANTPTLPTREPFNPLTLSEPSNTSNPLTQRVPIRRREHGADSVSSLGSTQQTHDAHQRGDGDAKTDVSPSRSPDQKMAIESLLGRSIAENEEISIRTTTSPSAPEWLQASWKSAKEQGLDHLSMEEIDAEIAAARKARRERRPSEQ